MQTPEITVLVSSYQRPFHLQRALLSLALQRGVQGKMDVVVTDDGSQDETLQVIEAFRREVDFPIRVTTHPHHGFQPARCRNEGVAATQAPYLLFTDGDCLLPPDHVAAHLSHRRVGTVIAGDCYRFDAATSERITEAVVRSIAYAQWVPRHEKLRIANTAFRGRIHWLLRRRMRPRLTGCNIGLWRNDFERINGFDENFVGWGLEDWDLQLRLSQLGLRFRSILFRTAAYHLWHPRHPTCVHKNEGTPNLRYYQRKDVATHCQNGLLKSGLDDSNVLTQ
jgi:glycosyltransferase involved in cell wall biosynthesis